MKFETEKKTNKDGKKVNKYPGIYFTKSIKDKTKTYYMAYKNLEGKSVKEKIPHAKTGKEAAHALSSKKLELSAHRGDSTRKHIAIRSGKATLNDLADDFFENRTTVNNIKDGQRYDLHIRNTIGSTILKKVDDTVADILVETLKKKKFQKSEKHTAVPLSNKTINGVTDQLRQILKYGVKKKWISFDPLSVYEKLPVGDNDREFLFNPEQISTLIDEAAFDKRLQMFVILMYYTAQRPESILRLRINDITEDTITFSAIKKQKENVIPISPSLREHLDKWIEENELTGDDYLISPNNNSGDTIKSKRMSYERMYDLGAILFAPYNENLDSHKDRKNIASFYSLRHSAATNMYTATKDLGTVQAVLGHSKSDLTERYAKVVDVRKKGGLDAL